MGKEMGNEPVTWAFLSALHQPSMETLTVWKVPPAELFAAIVYSPASRSEELAMWRLNRSPSWEVRAVVSLRGLPSLNQVTVGWPEVTGDKKWWLSDYGYYMSATHFRLYQVLNQKGEHAWCLHSAAPTEMSCCLHFGKLSHTYTHMWHLYSASPTEMPCCLHYSMPSLTNISSIFIVLPQLRRHGVRPMVCSHTHVASL